MSSAPKKRKIDTVGLLKDFIIVNHGEGVLQDLLESGRVCRRGPEVEEFKKLRKENEALKEKIRDLESKEPPSAEELLLMTDYEKLMADITAAENRAKKYWRLPPEIWCKILRYLPPKERVRIGRVDRIFREIVRLNGMHLFNKSQKIAVSYGNVVAAGEKYKISLVQTKNPEQKVASLREHLFARVITSLKMINVAKCEKTETFLLELPDLLQRYPQKFDIHDVNLILPRRTKKAVATLQSVLAVAASTVKHLSIENFDQYLYPSRFFDDHDEMVKKLNCFFKEMVNLESLAINQFLGGNRKDSDLVRCLEGLNLKCLGIGLILKNRGLNFSLLHSVLKNVSSRQASLENLTIYGVDLELEDNGGQCRQVFLDSRDLLKNVRNLGYSENSNSFDTIETERFFSGSPFATSVTELFEMFPRLQNFQKTLKSSLNPYTQYPEKILSFLEQIFTELKKREPTEMFTLKMAHTGRKFITSSLIEYLNSDHQHPSIRILQSEVRTLRSKGQSTAIIKMQSGDQHIILELCICTK